MSISRLIRTSALILCAVLSGSAFAQSKPEKDLVAYWRFDEGRGEVCRDGTKNRIEADLHGPAWAEGKFGGGISFDGVNDYIDCSNDPNLRLSGAFTMSVWVKPEMTGNQYIASKVAWNLFLGGEPQTANFETRNAANDGWHGMLNSSVPVPAGRWTFLAVVYDPERQVQEVYIDGILTNSALRKEPIGGVDASNLVLGRYAASEGQWFSGLMDEVRVYRRALSKDEIQSLFLLTPPAETARLELSLRPAPSTDRLVVDIDARSLPDSEVPVEISLLHGGKTIRQVKIDSLPESMTASITLDMKGLKPGEYEIHASAPEMGAKSALIWPEKPAWLGSDAGKTGKVFPPWTAIKIRKGDNIRADVWGRRYEFSGRSLVDRIESQGRSLLAGPVDISAVADGTGVDFKPGKVKLLSQSPSRMELEHRAEGSGLRLTVRTALEYDGMVQLDWKLEASRPLRLDTLILEIPLAGEFSTLMYSFGYGLCDFFTYPGDKKPGLLPLSGVLTGGSGVPVIWIGNEDVGLACLTESKRNWYNRDPDRATEIVCENNRRVLRFHLVDTPIQMVPEGKPPSNTLPVMDPATRVRGLDYRFILQATPVKPVDKTCWDYRVIPPFWYGQDYRMLTDTVEGKPALDYLAEKGVRTIMLLNWTDTLAYPYPVGHEKEFRDLVREAHKRGLKVIPYLGFQISENAPEWPAWGQEVIGLRSVPDPTVRGIDRYPGEPEQYVNRVCYGSAWSDFLLEGIARLMDEFDIDGVYLDTTAYPGACLNHLHGCGYVKPDGEMGYTHPTLAIRDMFKRMYAIVKSRKPDGIIDIHAPAMNIPAMSWGTSYWAGEGLPSSRDRRVLDVLPPDFFRAEFMGRQWGVPAEFLHYTLFPTIRPEDYRKALALSLIHDVPVRHHASTENLKTISPLWKLFDEFDRRSAEWFPYWRNSEYVTTTGENVYASLYKHPKNGVLLAISNLGTETAEVDVTLDLRKLKLPSNPPASNALTGEPVEFRDGRMRVPLPSMDWSVIRIGTK